MKKMSKGMLMTALICGAVYLGGSPVYANELQEFALDEYVVTAARTETKLVDTPANISVVDAKTIEESIHVRFDDKLDSDQSKLVEKFADMSREEKVPGFRC